MTKRTRALAGLTAGVLAVSAMAFGFSKWSSNVDLNGTVSANGKWEVAVTAADASISNTGAEMKKINTESSYTVVTYPVYVDYRASSGYYSFRIGDDKAAETKISYNDFMTNYEKNTAKWIARIIDHAAVMRRLLHIHRRITTPRSGDISKGSFHYHTSNI